MDSIHSYITSGEKTLSDYPDPSSTALGIYASYVQTPIDPGATFGISVICTKPQDLKGNMLNIEIFQNDQSIGEDSCDIPCDTVEDFATQLDLGTTPAFLVVQRHSLAKDATPSGDQNISVRVSQANKTPKQGPCYRFNIWSPKQDDPHVISAVGDPTSTKGSVTFTFKFRTLSELHSVGIPIRRELYCRCQEIRMGGAITCDNEKCEVGTWHRSCVGLKIKGAGEEGTLDDVGDLWFCPACRELDEWEKVVLGEVTDGEVLTREQRCKCLLREVL